MMGRTGSGIGTGACAGVRAGVGFGASATGTSSRDSTHRLRVVMQRRRRHPALMNPHGVGLGGMGDMVSRLALT